MNDQKTIIQLDQKTINKIAAGEVVERPASVVKELIENSIDAEATEITITIEGYGFDLIQIIDNGIGMSYDDALLAWKSHTTSKLKTIDDFDSIYSLGFRGEALASIASVSMMEIITKRKTAATGILLRIKGGTLNFKEERECSSGTIVSVRNLFFNVPARRKFMKTPTTELGHIIEIVNRQALIHPEIHFKLLHNKSLLLNSPKSNNPLEPFISIFGVELAKEMIPVDYENKDIKITGFTSLPSLSRSTRDYEMVYVNKRYIKSKMVSEAIEEAYKTLLMKNRFPITLLNLKINSAQIDVNIHPTKREVRFEKTNDIHTAVMKAISLALEQSDLWRKNKGLLESTKQSSLNLDVADGTISTEISEIIFDNNISKTEPKESFAFDTTLVFQDLKSADSILQRDNALVKLAENFWVKPLGQAHNLYILCETNKGIAIIDIHAAHERLRYEELLAQYEKSKIEMQELLQPLTLTLTKEQIAFLKDNNKQLVKIGINLENFGGNTFLIRKLPVIMDIIKTEDDIKNLIDEMKKDTVKIKEINERIELMLITMACHSVVRAGEAITLTKTIDILKKLSRCKHPFTCPHGRPTIIKLSKKNLEKEFGRIV